MSTINNNSTDKSVIEAQCNEIQSRKGWLLIYQEVRKKSEKEAKEKHFSTNECEKPQNRSLNRYRDVSAYDHSRIILHRGPTDYINANLVNYERAGRKYILTQGPLPDTVGHFWLMVWEQKTKAIIMLNKIVEKEQVKCHQYWPEKRGPDSAFTHSDVGLTVEYLRCEEYKNFSRRWFKLTDLESKQSREVIQFHYTTWPDFGIPSSPVAFMQFLKQVRDSGSLDPDVGPAVVHCSAGIGRSGTFCLVDCCLVLIEKEGEDKVSIPEVLIELRRYRMGLLQTVDQIYFSYQAIVEGIKLLRTSSFSDYEEIPIIPKDESMEETPPPLPPRTHSLQTHNGSNGGTVNVNNKPLPTIPNSESFNDEFISEYKNNDAINNLFNSEKNSSNPLANEGEINHLNRPLPPIPQQNSLDKVYESGSDENEFYEVDSDEDVHNKNDEMKTEKQSIRKSEDDNKKQTSGKQNGIDTSSIPSVENEVKRRIWAERQANIDQKVKEIKRKQREVEDKDKAKKKRRSFAKYIAAGVIVSMLCVYAYSKLA